MAGMSPEFRFPIAVVVPVDHFLSDDVWKDGLLGLMVESLEGAEVGGTSQMEAIGLTLTRNVLGGVLPELLWQGLSSRFEEAEALDEAATRPDKFSLRKFSEAGGGQFAAERKTITLKATTASNLANILEETPLFPDQKSTT